MIFAITARKSDGSGFKVIALQEGLSHRDVFDGLGRILELTAVQTGGEFFMKNHETWGIDNVLFSVEEVVKPETEENMIECIVKNFIALGS